MVSRGSIVSLSPRSARLSLVTVAWLVPACSYTGGDLQAPSPSVAEVVVTAPDSTLVVGETVHGWIGRPMWARASVAWYSRTFTMLVGVREGVRRARGVWGKRAREGRV